MVYVSYAHTLHKGGQIPKDLLMASLGKPLRHQGHSKNFFQISTFDTDDVDRLKYGHEWELSSFLRNASYEKDYTIFRIPKASGGYRTIEAPSDELKKLQAHLNYILTDKFKVLPHGAAYAYTKGRCAYDALVHHQSKGARWFLKLDLKDFFPSISQDVLKEQLPKTYQFYRLREEAVDRIIDIATNKNNVLPQGSPLSPLLSNIVMMDFDYKIEKKLWNYKRQRYTYTRYADDLLITSKYHFQFSDIIALVERMLEECGLPFSINKPKIRYGSSAGRNWNLGLMYTQDNKITIGSKRKKILHSKVHKFMLEYNHSPWEKQEVQSLVGNLAYLQMVEPDYYTKLIQKYNNKFNDNVEQRMKDML